MKKVGIFLRGEDFVLLFLIVVSGLSIFWFVGFVFGVGTVKKVGILRGGLDLFLCVLFILNR